ncbi:MAG: tetratricopeptide repeat protein [Chloroflexi bacterium]|nr:tetratricopeptide repeat protein [Chloroflexota bacterium]
MSSLTETQQEPLETRAARVANLLQHSGASGIILFLTYAYEATRRSLQTICTAQLAASNLQPVYLDLRNDKTIGDDLTYVILDHRKSPQDVVVVIGLGEPEIRERRLRSLNYRRELLVEGNVKVVFWLTNEEVREIAMKAPDFWAFTHRIIDFPEAASAGIMRQAYQAIRDFITDIRYESADELNRMIATREAILSQLPIRNYAQRLDLMETLGNLYDQKGDFQQSRSFWSKVLEEVQRGRKDEAREGRAFQNLGLLAHQQGLTKDAEELYREAQKRFERQPGQKGLDAVLHNLGMLASEQGRLHEAKRLYDESLSIARNNGDQRNIAKTLHQLGTLAQDQGDFENAIRLYQECLGIKRRLNDEHGIAATVHNLGMLAQLQGRFDEAEHLYKESMRIVERLGDQRGIAETTAQLGLLAFERGEIERAQELLSKSQELSERLGDARNVAQNYNALGSIYYLQGDIKRAINSLLKSLGIRERLGDKSGIAQVNQNLALITSLLGLPKESEELLRTSLRQRQEINDEPGVAETLHNLAVLAQAEGRLEEAHNLYQQSLDISSRLRLEQDVALTLFGLATLAVDKGQMGEGRNLYQQSLDTSRHLDDKAGIARSVYFMGLLDERMDLLEDALSKYAEASEMLERLKSPIAEVARRSLQRVQERLKQPPSPAP